MKRLSAPLMLVITMLLLVSMMATPSEARRLSGSTETVTLDHPQPPPSGGGSDLPTVLEGDPDELTGGNLSVTEPEKPGLPKVSALWQSFLSWIQQSAQKMQSAR